VVVEVPCHTHRGKAQLWRKRLERKLIICFRTCITVSFLFSKSRYKGKTLGYVSEAIEDEEGLYTLDSNS